MTICRDEVLGAFARLERRHGRRDFQLSDVVAEVLAFSSSYKESTIRTHVTSRMCVDSPDHHGQNCFRR
ncbi:MAG: hypothetical protein ACRDJ2_16400 [Actinomycetota bacterium]